MEGFSDELQDSYNPEQTGDYVIYHKREYVKKLREGGLTYDEIAKVVHYEVGAVWAILQHLE